jgi:hypothetical protein
LQKQNIAGKNRKTFCSPVFQMPSPNKNCET